MTAFARHWHDVTRLDTAGFADAAIADTALAKAVAEEARRRHMRALRKALQGPGQWQRGTERVPSMEEGMSLALEAGRIRSDQILKRRFIKSVG